MSEALKASFAAFHYGMLGRLRCYRLASCVFNQPLQDIAGAGPAAHAFIVMPMSACATPYVIGLACDTCTHIALNCARLVGKTKGSRTGLVGQAVYQVVIAWAWNCKILYVIALLQVCRWQSSGCSVQVERGSYVIEMCLVSHVQQTVSCSAWWC